MKKRIFLVATTMTCFFAAAQKQTQVVLMEKSGIGPFIPTASIVMPLQSKPKTGPVPTYLTEYVIRQIDYQSYNTSYKEVAAYGISKTEFLNHYRNKLDSTLLTDKEYNHAYYVLIGKNNKNEIVVIIDSNKNANYTDDKAFIFPVLNTTGEEKEAIKCLPSVELPFELYNGMRFVSRSYKIELNPYKAGTAITFVDPIENKYFLRTHVPVHRQGETLYFKKPYEIFLYGGEDISYAKSNAALIITPKGKKPLREPDGNIPYKVGDIITVNGHQYEFSCLSGFGDTAKFKYIGYNSKPEGFAENYYAPKVNAKTVDGKRFEFSNYKGKYILLDFWGTWCVPCLKALPEIKKLHERFREKGLVLVSVANDNDLEDVRKSISKNDMNWINVFQNEIAGGNQVDLIKKFKISVYPTLILIDKEGKIISRSKSVKEITGVLNKKL